MYSVDQYYSTYIVKEGWATVLIALVREDIFATSTALDMLHMYSGALQRVGLALLAFLFSSFPFVNHLNGCENTLITC